MNFFSFHIGDYASATRHLSWDEDCAYRRLLDTYYITEKPLPGEHKAVFRLAMARSKAQQAAVVQVLQEFFELTDDGWINRRADAEIASMRLKQEASEEKVAHESDRMKRMRERRAVMFGDLRTVGIVPAWDIHMKDLQRLHDEHCGSPVTPVTRPVTPETAPVTQPATSPVTPVTRPATAISTNTNTNTNKEEPEGSSSLATSRRKRIPPDFTPNETGIELARSQGIDVQEQLQRFHDYHAAKGSVMVDWQAAWRTWVGNAKTFARASGPPRSADFNRQEAIEQRNRAVGDEWLRQQGITA